MPRRFMSTSERKRGRLLLLRNEALRRLWATEIWSSAGEALGLIALPLLVYDRTDSARMVGLVSLLLILPRVFLSPVAGFLADHADRRQIMIAAFVERAVVAAIVPFTGATWQIGGLAIAMAVGNSFSRPAELSAIPSIAPPESLVQALSLIQVTNGIIRIAAPAAGAALIAASGPEPIFWIQALAYLAATVVVRRLVIPEDRDIEHWQLRRVIGIAKTEMWAGLAVIRSVPIVRGVTATESLWQLAGSALVVAGVVYTKDT